MHSNKLKHISEIIDESYSNLKGLSKTARQKTSLSKYLKQNLKNFGQYIVAAGLTDEHVYLFSNEDDSIPAPSLIAALGVLLAVARRRR